MDMMFSSVRQHRLCQLKVGENYGTYGETLGSYFKQGWKEKDAIKLAAAPFMAIGSILGEGLEPLAAGVVNQKLERPAGIAGRTRRDVKALVGDIVHLRPFAAIRDAWSLVTSDIPLDAAEAIIGYNQNGTRHSAQRAMKKEYALAA